MTTLAASLPVQPWSEEPTDRPDRRRVRAHIGGLHCSLCVGTIEKALGRRPGVHKVAVSLTHEQALVEFDPGQTNAAALMQTLRDIGYTLADPRKLEPFEAQERALLRERNRFLAALSCSLGAIALIANPTHFWALGLSVLVFASLILFGFTVLRKQGALPATLGALALTAIGIALFVVRTRGGLSAAVPWATAGLALILIFGMGRHILHMAVQALRRGILNQHVLVEIGAFAGLSGGAIGLITRLPHYPTAPFFAVAVMVLTYHIFSEWLSLIVKTRSSQAVKKLLDLQPDTAHVVREGKEQELPVDAVQVGEVVRIRPGERIPVDGTVLSGHSAVDQSWITGEPLPMEIREGGSVSGGAINGRGALLVRVTAVGEESFLQRIVRSVEDARALKPGLLHLVDRVLQIYTPAVLAVSVLAFLGWLVAPWLLGYGLELQRAVFAGLSVLVMGYPCAVGISAPLSIVRGANEAAERGILMRTGEAFQGLRKVSRVVLDKTGTLTEGKPAVREILPLNTDQNTLLRLAAAVEAASEHPLAQAVVRHALEVRLALPTVNDFEALAGKGAVARVEGERILIGSPAFLRESGISLTQAQAAVMRLEKAGHTVIGLARENTLLGLLALGDALRADAVAAVRQLKAAGLDPVLLTGDNMRAAHKIARQTGIEEVHAGVLPDEKAALVRRLQQDARVAMVGDGINDAPALMQADVGIAMGSGTDIAIDSADVIILNTRLTALLDAYQISRKSYRKMLQNVTLAFLFNGIGIPLAATGLIYPVWAMVAMASSVTAIFFNSLWGSPGIFFDAISSVGAESPEKSSVR